MAKKKKKKIVTDGSLSRKKLKDTPFEKVEDMKKASQGIRMKVWEQLERARVFNEMAEKEEYNFIKSEFKQGLKCKYGNADQHLVKVYSEGEGILIDINPDLAKEASQSGTFVESLIRSTGDTFSKSYYKTKGILPHEMSVEEVVEAMKKNEI